MTPRHPPCSGDVVAVARHKVRRAVAGRVSRPTPTCPRSTWARPSRGTTSASTSPTGRGVLAQVATSFAEHGVSIETVRQQVAPGSGERAKLIVVTHRASDAALAATVDALAELDVGR